MDVTQMVIVGAVVLGVVAFVVWPMVAGRRRHVQAGGGVVDDARIERRIGEYREALRRGTVCEHCLYPSAAGARFCSECGARLPAASSAGTGGA